MNHLTIHRAVLLEGEQPFLDAVVSDLTNSENKLVYADWLEEQGDPRAEFLREFVAASDAMDPEQMPDTQSVDTQWGRMIGAHIVAGLLEVNDELENAGLEPKQVRDDWLNLAVPALVYESASATDDDIPVGGTKLYGRPDLPAGTEWPRQKDGNSFYMNDSGIEPETLASFVCQINLAELAGTQLAKFFPDSGLISIFSVSEMQSIGMTEACVLFSPTDKLERMDPPEELDEDNELAPAHRLTFSETLQVPHPADESPFPPMKLSYSDDAYEIYGELLEGVGSGDQLNSLAGFTRPTTGGDPMPGDDFIKLICVENSMEIRLHFCIRRADAAKGNFNNVELAWVDFDG